MMNKLHMLALTGLIVSGVNSNASMMGLEQREVLYTLHTLGQNFADVPMIVKNVDMFMGVLEMNMQVNEATLRDANQSMKDALWNNAAFLTGAWISKFVVNNISSFAFNSLPKNIKHASPVIILSAFIQNGIDAGLFASKILAALNIHDVWKNRSELMEAIALDTEILSQLEEIKTSMEFTEENGDSAESFLLENAE
jgi:hypothetical protein